MKKTSVILMILILSLALTGCTIEIPSIELPEGFDFLGIFSSILPEPKTDEELIEERIYAFLDAYNSGDFDGAIACFDKKTARTIESAVNIGESVAGGLLGFDINMADLFGLSVGVASEGDLLTISDMEITITGENTATATTYMSYSDSYNTIEEPATFYMVKEGGDWYISNLQ